MQYKGNQSYSPLLKASISPQMSKSQMDKVDSNKKINGGSKIHLSARSFQLKEIKEKIKDMEKLIRNRQQECLSPSLLRGSVGTDIPEPKSAKIHVSPSKKPLNRQQLRSSWNEHASDMFESIEIGKSETKKTDIKNLPFKLAQISQKWSINNRKFNKMSQNDRSGCTNRENQQVSFDEKIEDGLKSNKRSSISIQQSSKLLSNSGELDLQKLLMKRNSQQSTTTQNQNIDKIRKHINRSMQVLDMIKNQVRIKIDKQKKSSIIQRSKTHKIINGFEFGRPLGKGKFGVVYLAKHIETGVIVAIKTIEKQKIIEANIVNQFAKEIRLHNSLDHPNIIKFYGFFEQKEDFFLVLQYLNGGSLFEHLNKVGFLGIKEAVDYLRDIIQGVAYLHDRSIAHRDIKPENIVISTQGIAKICDFGWASLVDSLRSTYCGTLDYVSPQILQRKDYGLSVDIWSIGILAYQMLMGKAPFDDKNKRVVRERIINVDKIEFNYASNIPEEAKQFIEALVQKDASKRPQIGDLLKFKLFSCYGSRAAKRHN